MAMALSRARVAARAVGRSIGALFFSVFGGFWLLLASHYFGRLGLAIGCLIAAAVAVLGVTAMRMGRRGREVAKGAYSEEEERRNGRAFGMVNAVAYGAIFLLFQILPRMGLSNYVFPAFVAIVGLHFFPMPPLYRHTANLVTGAAMVAWAVLCVLLFRSDGTRMAASVCFGAGAALWLSAGWALGTADKLLRSEGL